VNQTSETVQAQLLESLGLADMQGVKGQD